jgi:uroporphyrinogen decarboxylase
MKKRPELLLDVIKKTNTTYLPSQIAFSNDKTRQKVCKALGFANDDQLESYLENHIKMTVQLDDIGAYYCGNIEKQKLSEKAGILKIDWENEKVLDRWGMQFELHAPFGFFNMRHPLKDINDEKLDAFNPPSLDDMDLLFSLAEEDLKKYSEDYLVVVSGYCGIFERSYNLTSFEEFMYLLAAEPDLACRLMDKVLEYKLEIARQTVKRGFKLAHYGDDLGTQLSTFVSEDMFKSTILPRIKKLWRVYKDAGLPVQMHSCGNITKFIPYLIDIGLDVLEPTQPCMDLKFLKKEYGSSITFYGGIDTQNLLTYQSPQKVREETLRTIDILGNNGGYIVAPSQEIMPNVPVENVIALLEAIKEARGK